MQSGGPFIGRLETRRVNGLAQLAHKMFSIVRNISHGMSAVDSCGLYTGNYMLKAVSDLVIPSDVVLRAVQPTPGADQQEYRPYFARDGSLSDIIWQVSSNQIAPCESLTCLLLRISLAGIVTLLTVTTISTLARDRSLETDCCLTGR